MVTALTASLVLPVSTANASIHHAPVVAAEQTNAIPSGSVSLTINSFSNDTIYTSSGTLTISNALKPIFKSENRQALTNAQATVIVDKGRITDITSLTLTKKGTSKNPITFDGGQATIGGNLTVVADYTKVQNVTVKKELIVSNRVKKGLTLSNVSVGDTIKFQPLRMKKVNWLNVSLINMPKTEINVQRNKIALISDKSLTRIDVTDDVPQLKVEADVEKLVIDVKKDISLRGEGEIKHVIVKKGKKVDLDSYHQFKNVQVNDKTANVIVSLVDKTALSALINASAYVSVSANGFDIAYPEKWTTQAEKSTFESILVSAKTVANDPKASQEQVNAAHTQLNNAVTTYKAAQKNGKKHTTGDKAAISALINSVQYVTVSWRNGSEVPSNTPWTTQAEKDALVSAVSSAQAVVNNYNATQDQIVSTLNNLEVAISTYKNAHKYGLSGYNGDKSTLKSLIDSVYYVKVSWDGSDVSTNTAWTTQTDLDAIVSVVSSAQRIWDDYYATQNEITNAINNLNYAISTYKNAQRYGYYGYGDKTQLSSLLKSNYYVEVSNSYGQDISKYLKWTTQEAFNNFSSAVASAQSIMDSPYASWEQINTAVSNLQNAIYIYESSQSYGLLPY